MSFQSSDYPYISHTKKDRPYYSLFLSMDNQFISTGDFGCGFGRSNIHFYSHKVVIGIDRQYEVLRPSQSHFIEFPFMSFLCRYYSVESSDGCFYQKIPSCLSREEKVSIDSGFKRTKKITGYQRHQHNIMVK